MHQQFNAFCVKFTQSIDYIFLNTFAVFITFDKVKLVLLVTKYWALASLFILKIFETIFIAILRLPDHWLSLPIVQKHVKVLSASDGNSDITNKFKLFVKYYWENSEYNKHGGFNFNNFSRLFGSSVLYCSYLLSDTDISCSPEQFVNNIKTLFIKKDNDLVNKIVNNNEKIELPFGNVNFDEITEPDDDDLYDPSILDEYKL